MNYPSIAHIILVLTAAVLFYAAWTDLREFKIRNELIFVLLGLFILHAIFSGRWVFVQWNIALAFVMFLIMLAFYAQKWMGGGDVKILTVGFLWVGYSCALVFSVLLLGFVCLHAVAVWSRWGRLFQPRSDRRIAFAPAVAAALIVTFLTGCLQPPSHLPDLRTMPNLGSLSDDPGSAGRFEVVAGDCRPDSWCSRLALR